MSEHPRTDAVLARVRQGTGGEMNVQCMHDLAEFARTLEGDLLSSVTRTIELGEKIATLLARVKELEKLLTDARDDVCECLNAVLPNAGYPRYDRRIKDFQERLIAIDQALAAQQKA